MAAPTISRRPLSQDELIPYGVGRDHGERTLPNGRVVRTAYLPDDASDKKRRTVIVFEVDNPNPAPPKTATRVHLGAQINAVRDRFQAEFAALPRP